MVSGLPSTHFHWPSDPSSVSPIQTSLSLPNKLLMKVCQRRCVFTCEQRILISSSIKEEKEPPVAEEEADEEE